MPTLNFHQHAHDPKTGVFAGIDMYDVTLCGTMPILANRMSVEISEGQKAKILRCFEDKTSFDLQIINNGGGVRVRTY